MKELTFKEVIANIKEGEVWQGNYKTIERLEEGTIIKTNNKESYCAYGIYDDELFTLKRKEYTFTEAFKTYEEGKEIKSCVTGARIKKDEDGVDIECDSVLEVKEIRGKWYIEN